MRLSSAEIKNPQRRCARSEIPTVRNSDTDPPSPLSVYLSVSDARVALHKKLSRRSALGGLAAPLLYPRPNASSVRFMRLALALNHQHNRACCTLYVVCCCNFIHSCGHSFITGNALMNIGFVVAFVPGPAKAVQALFRRSP